MNPAIVRAHGSCKIILRARQTHLLDKFRSETKSITTELITQLRSAWATYVQNKVSKGLSEPDKVAEGEEEKAWFCIVELARGTDWKQECLKRDEKFDMHFSAAVSMV
jgi:cysteinyl-tRNA synthetase